MLNYNNDICSINQAFGANPQVYAPLAGHTGIDEGKGYGTPIHSPVDLQVYKVLTKENPSNDGSGFTGVFGIYDDGIEMYELLFGHCDPLVQMGQQIVAGEQIATEANHGEVFQGNLRITLAMQAAGDHRGSHRHVQKRPIWKSKTMNQPALSAYNDEGGTYMDSEGYYYPIWDFNNGFNGCVDPSKGVFTRDLTLNSYGYDVFVLQRILASEGLLDPSSTTGYFGKLTQQGITALQAKFQIEPDVGYFGPITRKAVVDKYNI